jgi:hypothetical protein
MHERGAPIWLWLILLVPVALARVAPSGAAQKVVAAMKWIVIVLLVAMLAPFVSAQVQQALYPQLEKIRGSARIPTSEAVADFSGASGQLMPAAEVPAAREESALYESSRVVKQFTGGWGKGSSSGSAARENANLLFEPDARIQTGPGIPDWTWRRAELRWNGPVTSSQEIQALLIPMPLERLLSALRVLLVLALGYALLSRRKPA